MCFYYLLFAWNLGVSHGICRMYSGFEVCFIAFDWSCAQCDSGLIWFKWLYIMTDSKSWLHKQNPLGALLHEFVQHIAKQQTKNSGYTIIHPIYVHDTANGQHVKPWDRRITDTGIFRQNPIMWEKQCHKASPSHHHFIGGINLPFPVMGGLWHCFNHMIYKCHWNHHVCWLNTIKAPFFMVFHPIEPH